MDEPDNDLNEPFLQKDDQEDEEDDDLDLDTGIKPHCLGHRFHWTEVLMLLLILAGVIFFFVVQGTTVIPGITYVIGGCAFGANVIGLMTIWNLAALKRIAGATDAIVQDIKRLRAENRRAQNMQKEMKEQDATFKKNLGDMKQASMLINSSAKSLDDIKAQEEEMMAERLKLLEERKILSNKMQEDMRRSLDVSFENVREEFDTRAMLFYEEGLRNGGGEGISIHSPEYAKLKSLLEKNSIFLNDDEAGDDGVLDKTEFTNFLDSTLGPHFEKLKDTAMRVHNLEMDMMTEKISAIGAEI